MGAVTVRRRVASRRPRAEPARTPRKAPELLIEIPSHAQPEREYALSVLLGDWLGLSYVTRVVENSGETRIRHSSGGTACVVLRDRLLAVDTPWLQAESLPPTPLPVVAFPAWSGQEGIVPVLYSAGPPDRTVDRDGDVWTFHGDLLGTALFLLTRYEELVRADARDEHGRFPATASALFAGGWIEWPVLDMYVEMFASLLRVAWPGLRLRQKGYGGVQVSHDIDHPASSKLFGTPRARLRVLAGDLTRRRDLELAWRRARAFATAGSGISSHDPFNTYAFLMQSSEEIGATSTFFVMADSTRAPHGSTYRLTEPWARPLLSSIAMGGHRIGLHASYHSAGDRERLAHEWRLLEEACDGPVAASLTPAVRQHFLRWDPRTTWQAQAGAGLRSDHSLGYADAVGFRAGTARSFVPYDLTTRETIPLRVHPLTIMDGTFLHYMLLGAEEALARTEALSRRVRRFGGSFSLLWHNSSLDTRRMRHFYRDLLASIAG